MPAKTLTTAAGDATYAGKDIDYSGKCRDYAYKRPHQSWQSRQLTARHLMYPG